MVKENFLQRRAREKRIKEGFEKSISPQIKKAEKDAYLKEAIKVAEERGKKTARKKTIRELISERASSSLRSRIQGTTPAMVRNSGGRFIRKAPSRRASRSVRRSYPTRRFPQQQDNGRMQPLGELVIGDLI